MFINPANYNPFIPPATATENHLGLYPAVDPVRSPAAPPMAFGISGVFAGAALVFFAYIGFDVVATTAEEARNPQRDLPIGIMASLVICTILYGAVPS